MIQPMMRAEGREYEPGTVQRWILLSFCATVLMAVGLCVVYFAGRTSSGSDTSRGAKLVVSWRMVSLPDPPAPLPASASPYLAAGATNAARTHSPLKLEMTATEDAWVEIETDGRVSFAKLVRAQQMLSFEASERIRMLTGNAPGLELLFNGEPVAANRAKRRVRTLEFTREGPRDLNPGQPVTNS